MSEPDMRQYFEPDGSPRRLDSSDIPRHPVDALKALGVPMTPEFEAQARAYCDEVVELPKGAV